MQTHYRAYDPVLGTWLSIDPLGELGGLNLYRYVLNQPVGYVDFLGLIEYGSWQYKLLTGGSGDFIENTANAITGFGDSFTLGLSQGIRKLAGTDHLVDKCSGAYNGGEVAGVVASVAVGGAGAARAAGGARNIARYELGSKWLPRLTQRAGRLERWNRYDQVTKGDIILKSANGNWIKAFAPETVIKPFSIKALATGPTPLAGGVVHGGAQIVVNELRDEDCD